MIEITSADGVVTIRLSDAEAQTMDDALGRLSEGFVRGQLEAICRSLSEIMTATDKEAHWAKLQALEPKDREQITASVEAKHAAKVKPEQGPPAGPGRPA